jgi:hypothetical protein
MYCFDPYLSFYACSMGVVEHLKSVYGPLMVATASGFDVSLRLDEATRAGMDAALITHVAMLRRHTIAAAFVSQFKALQAKATTMKPPVILRLRTEEPVYIIQARAQAAKGADVVARLCTHAPPHSLCSAPTASL